MQAFMIKIASDTYEGEPLIYFNYRDRVTFDGALAKSTLKEMQNLYKDTIYTLITVEI